MMGLGSEQRYFSKDALFAAADLVNRICEYVEAYSREAGFGIWPALVGWKFVEEAYGSAASPDGRRYGDPIAEHYCATPGRAKNGVTALLNSIAKAPLARALGIAPVHLSLPRNFTADEAAGVAILDTIFRAAVEKGLAEYNVAVYDADLLRRAQENPEAHQDLIVRVWGFSAKFIDLSREMQDHVISRIINC